MQRVVGAGMGLRVRELGRGAGFIGHCCGFLRQRHHFPFLMDADVGSVSDVMV